MKEALWGYWLVILGIFIIVVLLLVQSFTTTNTQDYYLVKSITEASMQDALDWSYYRLYGEIKINKEKFYESFLRRFAEEASFSTTYTVDFTEVYEAPPKVGVKVSSKSSTFNIAGDTTTFDIVNKIDAILESSQSNTESEETGVNPSPSYGDSTVTIIPGSGTTEAERELKDLGIDLNEKSRKELEAIAEAVETEFTGEIEKLAEEFYDKMKDFPDDQKDAIADLVSISYADATDDELGTFIGQLYLYLAKPFEEQGDKDDTEPEFTTVCTDSYTTVDISGLNGYGMLPLNVRDNGGGSSQKLLGKIEPGTAFKIVGTSRKQPSWLLVEYDNQECGYVLSSYVAVNLEEYFPKVGVTNYKFNITNKTASIYAMDDEMTPIQTSSGQKLTGKKLYTDDHKPLATYPFAQKLAKAIQSTTRTVVIYDTYRPYAVSKKVSDMYEDYIYNYVPQKGTQHEKDLAQAAKDYGLGWFLAGSLSTHNTACAADLTFEGAKMPTNMHVLGPAAAKDNDLSKELNNLMTGAGLTDLKSEWWHFQDNGCYQSVKSGFNQTNYKASFWSAV